MRGKLLDALSGKALFWWRRAFLAKFCRLVLPPPPEGPQGQVPAVLVIESYLAGLHFLPRLALMAMMDALNLLAIFLGAFRPMMWTPEPEARRYLLRLQASRSYSVRSSFAALKALVMLVYYADPAIEARVGYRDDCLRPERSLEAP
ncbi:MAG: hypothetical protein HYZ28_17945 [Myxococcales bacterium]|nr:hypothetical protein [Myxococcales bacterium]